MSPAGQLSVREARMRWFAHVERRKRGYTGQRMMKMELLEQILTGINTAFWLRFTFIFISHLYNCLSLSLGGNNILQHICHHNDSLSFWPHVALSIIWKTKTTLTASTGIKRVSISQVLLITCTSSLIICKSEHVYKRTSFIQNYRISSEVDTKKVNSPKNQTIQNHKISVTLIVCVRL